MPEQPDPLSRLSKVVSSLVTNTLVGVASLAFTVAGWVSHWVSLPVLVVVEAAVIVFLVATHAWTSQYYLRLRRADSKSMDDPAFFERFKTETERSILTENDELAEGRPKVYASEVPTVSQLLLQILLDTSTQPREVLATDLTTDPKVLLTRRAYREMNAELVRSGGVIRRVFVCWKDDLITEGFARSLTALVLDQRDIGVHCGLAERNRLPARQHTDFVVFARSAVLVEVQQADANYTWGQSMVHFRQIDEWESRFRSVWGVGKISADAALARYEKVVGPMLAAGTWDESAVRECVDGL